MNRRSMRNYFFSFASLFLASSVQASEYIYRDLMGNTLPPQKCLTNPEASARATDPYNIEKFTKRFCETQGYGWYVSEQKSPGKLVCEECSNEAGKFRCRVEDVVVTCKRLKPGTAGLIPGQS